MSVRPDLRAACLALLAAWLTPTALAQSVESAPLRQIDPWGVGWLGQADGALPASLWSASSAKTLLPLMTSLKPQTLSPAAQAALRRVLLSSARPPEDGADALEARLKLIEQAGEARRSIDLRRRFPDTAWGHVGESMAGEFELAAGRSETACATVADRRADDVRWMPSRALCYALSGDFDAASLVVEQTPHEDGSDHAWLISASETMRQPGKTLPAGRYDTPFEAAVSIAAGLPVPAGALNTVPGDLALSILRHPRATADQRREALRPALRSGLATGGDIRSALVSNEAAGEVKSPAAKPAPPSPRDLVRAGLLAAQDASSTPEQKAEAFLSALLAAGGPEDGRIAALALEDSLVALPRAASSPDKADAFARALLLAGNLKAAADWRALLESAADAPGDPWAAARIDFMIALAANTQQDVTAILDRLLAATPPKVSDVSAKTQTPAQKRDEARRLETTRALFLAVGVGRSLSPAARALIASQKSVGKGVPDAALARIQSATEAGAHGEAALAGLALIGEDASALSFAGLADILTLLRRSGLSLDADRIALEAMQPWKTF